MPLITTVAEGKNFRVELHDHIWETCIRIKSRFKIECKVALTEKEVLDLVICLLSRVQEKHSEV